ncbi:hypothetical protein ACP70R_002862 [Stipagrostis hirtigluma subsp. patula]
MALSLNTKSTSTTRTMRGEHRFDIAGYGNKLRAVTSDTFAVAGCDWAIRYDPNDGDGDEAQASVFLRLATENATARALFDIRLVDRATGQRRSVRRTSSPVAFDASKAKKRKREARAFMSRSELAASPYLRDDRLTVECVLDVVLEPSLTPTTAAPGVLAQPPPPDLWKHLGALLRTPETADVAFTVQGESFRAHRIVLAARSPVFKATLSPEGETSKVVTIDGVTPLAFKALLHFIYTDALPAMDDLGGEEYQELVRNLLEAADRYDMERLKQVCRIIMEKGLDAKTVAVALASAGQHHHGEALGDACVQFMPSGGLEG